MCYAEWDEGDWSTLIYTIRRKNCILMLGPYAETEKVKGVPQLTTEILANELAEKVRSKIEAWNIDSSNLAQVAQFYAMEYGRNDLEEKVFSFYDKRRHLGVDSEFHRNLAALPFSFTVVSTPDKMFYNALKKVDKIPIIERYNFRGNNLDLVEMGTEKNPLVFYLYGTIDESESLVLTENDLLDFLVAVLLKNPPLPKNILSELRSPNKSLLFLGFGFKNWYLRILLHVLQGHSKESRSFALEEFTPRNEDEFKRMVLFYRESDYRIQICKKEINSFVKELKTRYQNSSMGEPQKHFSLLPESAPTVFICHASEDKAYAASFYHHLREKGFKPWLDKESLRGGDMWDPLIEKTIKKVDYFIVLQSRALAKKLEGYVNKEIHFALDRQRYFRPGIRFIIPIKIEDCPLLEELDYLQTLDLSKPDNIEALIKTIKRDQERRKKG